MATTTFVQTFGSTWDAIVAGSAATSAYVQAASGALKLIVASSPPAAGATGYLTVNDLANIPSVTIPLATGDTLYGQALNGSAVARGFLVGV
ncbi:MAG: hypothetical protein KGL35_24375 [Bradyrhizobium sp.]|nr:hypothetical protein [Bradyrhizobium sp.]